MWVYNGDCSYIYGNEESFTDEHGVKYSGTWDKSSVAGMQQVVRTQEPTDAAFRTVCNEVRMVAGEPTVVWFREPVPPPTPAEIEANRVGGILAKIAAIEATITNRRIREATLTDGGKSWLASADAQISALRAAISCLI